MKGMIDVKSITTSFSQNVRRKIKILFFEEIFELMLAILLQLNKWEFWIFKGYWDFC